MGQGREIQHGHSQRGKLTPEYTTWVRMKARCTNPKIDGFKYYGARGISVCDRWNKSFPDFLADMGYKPSNEYSIERIDCNGNYCPENCKWILNTEQSKNRRMENIEKRITFNGETHSIWDWAKIVGITHHALYSRIKRGWTIERALTTKTILKTDPRTTAPQ